MSGDTEKVMADYWADAFPPWSRPWALPYWLLRVHTGALFAYPIGSDSGGGTATATCFLAGAVVLWRSGRWRSLALGMVPLGLAFLAASARRYPYGEEARTMQFVAPAICLFAGLGLSHLIGMSRRPAGRRILASTALAAFLGLGLTQGTLTVARPYTWPAERDLRQFAIRFYREEGRGAVLACSRADLGLAPGSWYWTQPGVMNRRGSEAYHAYRRLYAPRPLGDEVISEARPLRCVFYEALPEGSAAYQEWRRKMAGQFVLRDRREHVCQPEGLEKIGGPNKYVVLEFVPRAGPMAAADAGTVRR
jgi:hypothetical protein